MTEAPDYDLSSYDYELPPGLIAREPAPGRSGSRLLVLSRRTGAVSHGRFRDIASHLRPGDVLCVNDTRVVPARLLGAKETGGSLELLVMEPFAPPGADGGVRCLVRASKAPKAGARAVLEGALGAVFLSAPEDGIARVRFDSDAPLLSVLEAHGRVPLPPYIPREGGVARDSDRAAYQTVYAKKAGAVAAPTAGLHFTDEILSGVAARGVSVVSITLHVGYGTFSPIRAADIREHVMHAEHAEVSPRAASVLDAALREGRRIVAVGTTVVRTLEWAAHQGEGRIEAFRGPCAHYIYPGSTFRAVSAIITNFHLPQSSLILLVSAFAGRGAIMAAYAEAVRERYRFFSYGDAMLIA